LASGQAREHRATSTLNIERQDSGFRNQDSGAAVQIDPITGLPES